MKFSQVVAHYGGTTRAAEALGCAKQTVDSWKTHRIPSHWQAEIEVASEGKLTADKETYRDAKAYSEFLSRQPA